MHPQKPKPPDFRKIFLNLHLYAGLLCAPYLVIYGVSSLNFNHQFKFAQPTEQKSSWETSLPKVPVGATHQETADRTRDALGMMGWAPYWELRPGENGDLHFAVEHPGRSYKVHLQASERKAVVEERPKGCWSVLNSLHGLTEVPNSRLSQFWGFYTRSSTWVIIFIALSGVWLWTNSKRERKTGTVMILSALATSIVFMALVVLKG